MGGRCPEGADEGCQWDTTSFATPPHQSHFVRQLPLVMGSLYRTLIKPSPFMEKGDHALHLNQPSPFMEKGDHALRGG